MTRRVNISILSTLLFSMVLSCTGEVDIIFVEAKQNDFENVTLSVFKKRDGQNIYLANRKVSIIFGNTEFELQSNTNGIVSVQIPLPLTTKIENIQVIIDRQTFTIPYQKRRILAERAIQHTVKSYYAMVLNIKEIKKFEASMEKTKERFTVEETPFKGKVIVELPGKIEKIEYTGNGEIQLNFSSEEVRNLLKERDPSLILKFEDGSSSKIDPKFIPLKGKVELENVSLKPTNFTADLVNGTLNKVQVAVRAGYIRNEREWLIIPIVGIKCFDEKTLDILPGERIFVELAYPTPPFGEKKSKYQLEILKEEQMK